MPSFLHHLPVSPDIRPRHALTYLLALPFSSIALLVFLNASLSFLLTTLFHTPPTRLGHLVGTLGFLDEAVALPAAPLWGWLSDGRLGARRVAATGYTAISLSLLLFVLLPPTLPSLLAARTLFALGAAATTTMVSAMLPPLAGRAREGRLAGLVGLSSGLGALAALSLLLPLPSLLQPHYPPATAVRTTFLAVAALAAALAATCAHALPRDTHPPRETWKRLKTWVWTRIWGGDPGMLVVAGDHETGRDVAARAQSVRGLVGAVKVGWRDGRIGVAYVGGFVARAASVAISLFMPLWVNYHFVRGGACADGTSRPRDCARAYVLAAALTGTSQLAALLLAPVFGILADRASATAHLRNLPIMAAAALGIAGFTLFPLAAPARPAAFACAALAGASQIGAIVASLGLLTQGITSSSPSSPSSPDDADCGQGGDDPATPLLPKTRDAPDRLDFKGSIAGVYSLAGAAAILLLTKVGGNAFDRNARAPFWLMAGFNAVLLLLAAGEMVYRWWRSRG